MAYTVTFTISVEVDEPGDGAAGYALFAMKMNSLQSDLEEAVAKAGYSLGDANWEVD